MRALTLVMTVCLLLAACEKRKTRFTDVHMARQDKERIETFFRDYAEAFRSRSTARLLGKFAVPLTFLTRTGPIVFQDAEHLSANLDALLRRYDAIEAVDWKYTIKEVHTIGSGIYQADIEWRFFDPRNELLYACDTSYFLAGEAKGGAKVMAVIAHNEMERYEEALKRRKPDHS